MSDLSCEADLLVAAFQSLPIAVVTTDVQGIARSINPALTSLTGYTAEETVGQPVTLFPFVTAQCTLYEILQQAIQSGELWRGRWVCRRRTGELFMAELTVTSIKSPDGEILRMFATIQDISGREQEHFRRRTDAGRRQSKV